MKKWIVENILKARWIVNGNGEMGIRVLGINMWYYKLPEPLIAQNEIGDPPSEYDTWRIADKREFGEVVRGRKYEEESK